MFLKKKKEKKNMFQGYSYKTALIPFYQGFSQL